MMDKLFFIVLVLNLTGLFRFLAPQFGVSIGQVSMVLLWINIFYLMTKSRYLTSIIFRGDLRMWLLYLFIWPLITIIYAPLFEIRDIGLLLYYVSLFFGTIVFTAINGLPTMSRLISISILITIFGLLLSMVAPQLFETVAEISNGRSYEQGRAIGFFMQPNSLAVSFCMLFIGWFALRRQKKVLLNVILVTFLFFILLTGSRTGMLLAIVVVISIKTYGWRRRKNLLNASSFFKMGVLIICLVGGIIFIRSFLSSYSNTSIGKEGLITRMQTMLSFKLSDESIMEDTSVQERRLAQSIYLLRVAEKPLLGHGFGSDLFYKNSGAFTKSSHSSALSSAFEYGVLYPIVFYILLILFYKRRCRQDVEKILQSNFISQFVLILSFLFIFNGGLFDSRTFYVIFGTFFSLIYYPQYIFAFNSDIGRFDGVLTHYKIVRHDDLKNNLR